MTDPAPPGTDPANPPAPAPPAPADPAPPVPPADPAPTDPPADPADDGRIKRANDQAAAARVELRETKEKLDAVLAGLAGIVNPDANKDDPAAVAASATAQVESLRGETAALKAELLVHTIAGDNGGNPVKLLDSRAFTNKLATLDISADDYSDQVAQAIKDAVSKDATLAGTGQAPARGGAPDAGKGPAAPGAVTQEQFNAMGLSQRSKLFASNPDLYRRLAEVIR